MRRFWILAFLIILLGGLPRAIELISGNYLFGFDQGLFFQAVKSIVVDHKLTLIGAEVGGQGGFFQGPGWYYLLSIPFFLTNGNPYGAMVLMFIIGVLTIFFGIYFTKQMFGEKTALLFGLLLATSQSLIAQSRFIWPPFPISLLTVIFLYCVFQTLKKNDRYFILGIFCIGLMSHFETATSITFLIQTLIFVPVILFKKILKFKNLIFAGFAFILTQLPLIFFDLRHNFLITKGILGNLTGSSHPKHKVTQLFFDLMVKNHRDVFISNFSSTFSFLHGSLWILMAILLSIGVFVYLKSKESFEKKAFVFYLFLSPFILFAVFLLYVWPMWEWWILELPIFYCLLTAILLGSIKKRKGIITAILVSFVILLIHINFTIDKYRGDLFDYGGTAKVKGKIDALDYVYKDAKGTKFNLLVFTPPIYTYEYDFLIWWYGERKFHYVPGNEKKGTFYLLIQPDPAKPWSYKGWLETVIKTGTIENTVTLPSGLIVQKRNAI